MNRFALRILFLTALCAVLPLLPAARAQTVPGLINYQGRVVVGSTNFSGTGLFKFALVSADGNTTYWSNDGTSTNGSQPTNAVSLTVSSGLYALALGDTSLTNMTAIPASVFTSNTAVYLRVWFDDGTDGSQLLSPDERITSVGYAMLAAGVPSGSITATQLAAGSVGTAQLASGAVMATDIASGAITSTQLAAGSVGTSQLASNLTASGTFTVGAVLALPNTISSTSGLVTLGGNPFLHAYGQNNVFLGKLAGNFTLQGGYNTGIGIQALSSNTSGSYNTALGYEALFNTTTGADNTAIGYGALAINSSGADNTASGYDALVNNSSGKNNTAVGSLALQDNSSANDNTAIGYGALNKNTTGTNNTATGYQALQANTTGGDNTASGDGALYSNTTAGGNTASGNQALFRNTTGIFNTASGDGALYSNTTGGSNTALGNNAGTNLTTGNNNIDIANDGMAAESNTIRIGAQGTQSATYIAGISGTTSGSGVAVYVNSNGQLGTLTSSARYKQGIRDMDQSSEAILALRPVDFEYKPEIDPAATPQFGLVAEEVEKVCPALVAHDDKGQAYTVRYEAVNAMLLNEFLKEHRRVQDLEQRLASLERLLPPAATGTLRAAPTGASADEK